LLVWIGSNCWILNPCHTFVTPLRPQFIFLTKLTISAQIYITFNVFLSLSLGCHITTFISSFSADTTTQFSMSSQCLSSLISFILAFNESQLKQKIQIFLIFTKSKNKLIPEIYPKILKFIENLWNFNFIFALIL